QLFGGRAHGLLVHLEERGNGVGEGGRSQYAQFTIGFHDPAPAYSCHAWSLWEYPLSRTEGWRGMLDGPRGLGLTGVCRTGVRHVVRRVVDVARRGRVGEGKPHVRPRRWRFGSERVDRAACLGVEDAPVDELLGQVRR